MIKITKENIEVEGDVILILSEITSGLASVISAVSKNTGSSEEAVLATILEALQFNKLCSAGMAQDDAYEVLAGKKE